MEKGKDGPIIAGMIGAGRIGRLHAENIQKNIPGFKLKTVADPRLPDEEWRRSLGIPRVTNDYKEILEDDEIQAVFICSSTDTHAMFIQEAANAGKDIFCEKPIDYDLERIRKTLEVVEGRSVKLMLGFNRRFDHNFARVRKAVENGEIGKPHLIRITSRDPAPPPIEYIKVSGGLFFDMTIHDWDMARFLAGEEVVDVFARGDVLVDPKIGAAGDIDTAVAILTFESGAMATIDNSRQAVYGYDQRVEVFGSAGCAVADNDFPTSTRVFTRDATYQDKIPYFFLERYMQSYQDELRAFHNCLSRGLPTPVDGNDGLQAVLIAMAAKKSLDEGRPVKIKEVDV